MCREFKSCIIIIIIILVFTVTITVVYCAYIIVSKYLIRFDDSMMIRLISLASVSSSADFLKQAKKNRRIERGVINTIKLWENFGRYCNAAIQFCLSKENNTVQLVRILVIL